MDLLPREFFVRDSLTVARQLLGKLIVRKLEGQPLICRIVETEAYDQEDPASHSYRGKTRRTEAMFEAGGISYVYFIYGMYHCFNVVTDREGYGSAVLVRAAQPVSGIHLMWNNRFPHRTLPEIPNTSLDMRENEQVIRMVSSLANGPGKLAQALRLTMGEHNGMSLQSGPLTLWDDGYLPEEVTEDVRIGISVARERRWRFYVENSRCVSRRIQRTGATSPGARQFSRDRPSKSS